MTEKIAAAAIRVDGQVYHGPPPARHHSILHAMWAEGIDHTGHDQGFVTSSGRYVDREEALKIAEAAGQMKPRLPGQYDGPELFSEDLW